MEITRGLLSVFIIASCVLVSSAQKKVCTQEAVADVVFLVDGSASIGIANFQQIRQFLLTLVDNLNVGPNHVRIGLIQYSNIVRTEFLLNTFQDKEAILQYIRTMRYMTGGTNTGQGLEFMLKTHFVEQAGSRAREGVAQIAVVITDGKSQDNVLVPAQELRRHGITLYAIGIKDADETQLEEIANEPHALHVYSVSDFAALQGISQNIIHMLCTTVEEAQREVTMVSKVCMQEAVADVVFLVDGSASIGIANFQQIRQFLLTLVDNLNVGPNHVRIGLIQYSNIVRTEFLLNTFQDKEAILQYIRTMRYMTGGTNTGQGLEFMLKTHFVEQAGSRAREGVAQIAVVITDGKSQDNVLVPAQELRRHGITLYAIGIKDADETQLKEIANEPHALHVYSVSDFAALQGISQNIIHVLCTTVEEAQREVTMVSKGCQQATLADIVFLVDGSGSISEANFQEVKRFLHTFVEGLEVGTDRVRVGLAQFSDNPKQEFLLNHYADKRELLERVDNLRHLMGRTYTGKAIAFLQNQYFTKAAGSRAIQGVPQIAVVLTDGVSDDVVEEPAQKLREQGVIVFAIGVGGANVTQLRAIANSPHERFLVSINNFQQLQSVAASMMNTVCVSMEDQRRALAPKYADVFFMVDSLAQVEYQQIRSILHRVTNQLNVGKSTYRIGLGQFGQDTKVELQFNANKNKTDVLANIRNLRLKPNGERDMGKALEYARTHIFNTEASSQQPGFRQYLVMLTAGKSADSVFRAARTIKNEGVTVMSVGLGKADAEELEVIATPPYSYQVEGRNIAQIPQQLKTVIESEQELKVTQDCMSAKAADIVFIVDQSGSIGVENFQLVRSFLHRIIDGLEVDKGKVRVGVVMYSDEPRAEVYLNSFSHKSDILQYIKLLPYRRGGTYTGRALKFALEKVFTKERGSRRDQHVQQVAVVITDGKSMDNVSNEAAELRRSGVIVFALGVKDAKLEELKEIASYPDRKFVFNVKSFAMLNTLVKSLTKTLCYDINHSFVSKSKDNSLKKGCKLIEEADIYFLIDHSGSIYPSDFQDMKKFILEFLLMFPIGPHQVRVGVVKFASSPTLEFPLTKYTDRNSLEQAVDNVLQVGGGTDTGEALAFMAPLFKEAWKSRGEKVHEMLIIITDGKSQDDVKLPAEDLRNQGISIYAIGVKDANEMELTEITGDPKRKFFVTNYDALKPIKEAIVTEICSQKACKDTQADIVFLIDSSENVDADDFEKMKAFMESVIGKVVIGKDDVRIGIMQFSTEPEQVFALNSYDDKAQMLQRIKAMQLLHGDTFTGSALNRAAELFDEANGGRSDVPQFLILITDGESKDPVAMPAKTLRNKEVIIYSIGMVHANNTQLRLIAGYQERVYLERDSEGLSSIGGEILFQICNTDCKRPEAADMIFLVDGSGSNKHSFQDMLQFMIAVVNNSEVGQKQVRFGTIIYSGLPETKFNLSKYYSKAELRRAISALQSPGGENRNTARALQYSLSQFGASEGGRRGRNIPQVLFLITDGVATDSIPANWAETRRLSEINMFAIGVAEAQASDLEVITGDPKMVFYVDDIHRQEGLHKNINKALCHLSKPVCEKEVLDLVILIDGSESIKAGPWRSVKDFMLSLVEELQISPNQMRVGVAQFEKTAQKEFYLNEYDNLADVKKAIEAIEQMRGGTIIGNALKFVRGFFETDKGSRINSGISQNLLLFTDGESVNDNFTDAVNVLRALNIEIFVIGVRPDISEAQLKAIAGSPDRLFITEDFDSFKLKSTILKVLNAICTPTVVPPPQVIPGCTVDIGIGFDVSRRTGLQSLFSSRVERQIMEIFRYLSSLGKLCCTEDTVTANIGFRLVDEAGGDMYDYNFKPYDENVVRKVMELRPAKATSFNTQLLVSFQNKFATSSNAGVKVLIIFTDGLDDVVEDLMEQSYRLRKSSSNPNGIDMLLTVALEGFQNIHNLQKLEFGRGFSYKQPFTINTHAVASIMLEQLTTVALSECCNVSCACTGHVGPRGPWGTPGGKGDPGMDGHLGYPGEEGEMGDRGPLGLNGTQGHQGCPGKRGLKGSRGYRGNRGENGEDGLDGVHGEQGATGSAGAAGGSGDPGSPGRKGIRGGPGPKGDRGLRGNPGRSGLDNTVRGPKGDSGNQGIPGVAGLDGELGPAGVKGNQGPPGRKGPAGAPGGPPGSEGATGPLGPPGYQGPPGSTGLEGTKGSNGQSGLPGCQGPQGPVGDIGPTGSSGPPGSKGPPGDIGMKGDLGPAGCKGPPGQDGKDGFGPPGHNGRKGNTGCPGNPGLSGEDGFPGKNGTVGPKGNPGADGDGGRAGAPGDHGDTGLVGHRGRKGPPGSNTLSDCQLVNNVRDHCPCCQGQTTCPAYPTELVIALDQSADVTPREFETMRSTVLSLLEKVHIAESNCPSGARVSVVSYNSDTKYLIRFSDHRRKKQLLDAVKNIALERTSSQRNIGEAMRFVGRNIFKRIRHGVLMRKVAVFLTNGPSEDTTALTTAMLEYKALDISLGVIALRNAPDIRRAFLADETESFLLIEGERYEEGYRIPGLNRINECVICYDPCRPARGCVNIDQLTAPQEVDLDLVVLVDGSSSVQADQYAGVKQLLASVLDQIAVSTHPSGSNRQARVALYQHSSSYDYDVKEEFSLQSFQDRNLMKTHIFQVMQQTGGTSRLENALEWTITNILLKASTPRKKRMVLVIIGEETSYQDRAHLEYVSKLAKCQDVVMFTLTVGDGVSWTQVDELTSFPLEQHTVYLGQVKHRDQEYAQRFLRTFLRILSRELFTYSTPSQARECKGFVAREDGWRPIDRLPTLEEEYTEDLYGTEEPQKVNEPEVTEEQRGTVVEVEIENGGQSSGHEDVHAQCDIKMDVGTYCGKYVQRWFYNNANGACSSFWYGGCDGNSNRFNTEDECFKACGTYEAAGLQQTEEAPVKVEEAAVFKQTDEEAPVNVEEAAGLQQTAEAPVKVEEAAVFKQTDEEAPVNVEDVCLLKQDAGSCSEFSMKWYFDRQQMECTRFWYGGCGGNGNQFETQEDCETRCVRAR